jgi:prophage regulatory protein
MCEQARLEAYATVRNESRVPVAGVSGVVAHGNNHDEHRLATAPSRGLEGDCTQLRLDIKVRNLLECYQLDATRMDIKPKDLLGTQECAKVLGLRKENFLRDHAKRPDFPRPFAELAATRVWLKGDVLRYAAGLRKPR